MQELGHHHRSSSSSSSSRRRHHHHHHHHRHISTNVNQALKQVVVIEVRRQRPERHTRDKV